MAGKAHGSLAEALLAVQAEAETILKDKENKHGGFWYTSADAAVGYGRKLLCAHGLVFRVRRCRYEQEHGLLVVRCEFVLTHPATKEEEVWESDLHVETRRGMPMDKATLAVRTELVGYAIRDLLLLDRGNGPDVSGRKDDDYKPEKVEPSPEEIARRKLASQVKKEYRRLRQDFGTTAGEEDSDKLNSLGLMWSQIASEFAAASGQDFDPGEAAVSEGMLKFLAQKRKELEAGVYGAKEEIFP